MESIREDITIEDDIAARINNLPELARDSRLDTKSGKDFITHLYRDRPGRHRQERWNARKELGRGSFGLVLLYERSSEHGQEDPKKYRAVKELTGPPDLYKHELVALAKFSHQKVSSISVA